MFTRPVLLAALAGAFAALFYGVTGWLNPLLHAPYQRPPNADGVLAPRRSRPTALPPPDLSRANPSARSRISGVE